MRVLRIPYSTNVERVALALGIKGVAVEWVDVDPHDRSAVRAVSDQDLVPVLVADGEVVTDSTRILRWLEARHPDPPLWPAGDEAARAEVDLFCEWFDEIWKGPPNRIADGAARSGDPERLRAWLGRFEALLDGREFLLGAAPTAADLLAFPFLVYGGRPPAPDDTDPFHAVLAEHLPIATGPYPRLRAWLDRVDALPRS